MMESTRLYSLDDFRSLWTVRGTDADTLLQGQCTADLRRLEPGHWTFAGFCSPKGRMLALATISGDAGQRVLEVERELADGFFKRLRMYVLRAQVVIEPAALAQIAVAGPQADALLRNLGLAIPPAGGALRSGEVEVLARHWPGTYSLRAAVPMIEALRAQLATQCAAGSETDWRRAEITAGVPTVRASTREHFIPQMANLDLLGAIGLDKGCYTGQEVVARLHYLGQVKRRLYLCAGSGQPPAPGAVLRNADGAEAGEVCDSAADGAGFVATAVLQTAVAAGQPQLDCEGVVVEVVKGFAAPTSVVRLSST